ncbi:uncharacterized protein BDR25DRAFT_284279 [Lindgomyces ingoldianus]|uniref:Uncharacterized protein n=1 Tax=Lindgomyces ingoldianus TaxID=673940 RepID=A0ACB6QY40_9PLEO|nr:uncharacterized protein BDR25DRAFT_284279 [Lindgomyces ingoldianus]KAF2471954.1 hypothetical protein BDR25DRAFT_284279 [Lindgomyces ingoldianus]
MSPSANESHDFTFITGSKPDDFKDKVVMTTVRKRAMGSYLEKEKKSRPSVQRTRLNSEDSTSNANLQLMPTSKAQITRLPPSIDVVLPSAPMVEGMRPGRLMYDKNPVAAFQSPVFQVFPSIGKPLDPFKTMHQPQHPGVSVEELKFHCSRFFGTRAMGRHWIPTLVKSPHAFLSTLCIASAHHDAISSRSAESFQTLALRQEVIHLIGRNILDREQCVSDFNIIALTQLICSEIIAGEKGALGYHEGGIEKMVNLRGGLRQLGNLSNLFFPPAPTPNPAGPSALLISLKTAIDSSDLSDCWSDMAGVLLWIGLVAGATSHKSDKVVKKWFSALAVRCSIVLCFEHPEAVHCTLLKMGEVIEGVGFRSGNEAITRREGVKDTGAGAKAVGTKAPISGKKRRL